MTRNLKAIAMVLMLPLLFAFAVVFFWGFVGIERDANQLFDRAYYYALGIIVSWWLWGAR